MIRMTPRDLVRIVQEAGELLERKGSGEVAKVSDPTWYISERKKEMEFERATPEQMAKRLRIPRVHAYVSVVMRVRST